MNNDSHPLHDQLKMTAVAILQRAHHPAFKTETQKLQSIEALLDSFADMVLALQAKPLELRIHHRISCAKPPQ